MDPTNQTTKDITPLLTSTDLNQENLKKQHSKIWILISSSVIIILIGALIFLLYYFEVWASEKQSTNIIPGLYGKYPVWGGNMHNQQISPLQLENNISIRDYNKKCVYVSSGSHYNYGFTVIDNTDNAYITDESGYVTSIDLNKNCSQIWRINIANSLCYNNTESTWFSRNGMSIYMNSDGIKSLIIGTPNGGTSVDGSCWILSLNANTGELLWKLNIRELYNKQVTINNKSFLNISNCQIQGLMIDGQYGYGGLKTANSRGRFMKIDLENVELVDTFYTISSDIYDLYTENDIMSVDHYIGASPWNWPAIIDDYVIFGSGQVQNMPQYVDDCIINNNISYLKHSNYSINACGEDVSEIYPRWKCLELGVYQDSFNILKHKTADKDNKFEHIKSIPLLGIDVQWGPKGCVIWNPSTYDECPYSIDSIGTDSDIVAVAAYHGNDSNLYGAGLSKSGMFVVFDIITGDLKISKKVGIASTNGGGQWSLAVDENSMIAIATIVGGAGDNAKYKTLMADGNSICNAGSIHAIDLNTGYTIWQSPNPYAIMNESCDNINDTSHPFNYDNYRDYPVEFYGVCQRDFNGNYMKLANKTAFNNVTYIDLDGINIEHKNISNVYERAKYFGPVNIANNMVFVPSYTGDVFVHDLLTGEYIHRLQCDDYWNNVTHQWNRPGIHGGVTVSDKFVIFYCGASYSASAAGNQLTVYSFN